MMNAASSGACRMAESQVPGQAIRDGQMWRLGRNGEVVCRKRAVRDYQPQRGGGHEDESAERLALSEGGGPRLLPLANLGGLTT